MQPMHKRPEFLVFLQSTLAFLGFLLIISLIEGRIESKTVYEVDLNRQIPVSY
ncbi:MAG: hypothetical protein MUD14_27640 [Hydrococcus sp. Prado102]|jgi:hypothetical protein|nr:hypothetical protein [Hydrococcus sp. Prado102]